ncbi:MAG: hypothetical protein RR336_06710 [Oscillospiraceae bacterium]
MKKVILLCLSLTLAFALTACGEKKPDADATPTPETTEAVTPETTPEATPEITPEAPVVDGTETPSNDQISGSTGGNGGTHVTFDEGPAETPKPTKAPGMEASGMVPAKPGISITIK